MLDNEIKLNSIEDCIAYLFGFDTVSITPQLNCHFDIKAEINKGETVINFYKLFDSFLNVIDKCEKDYESLTFFKSALKQHKDDFDKIMDARKAKLEKFFKKHNPTISISYSGEFGKIYDKVKSVVE